MASEGVKASPPAMVRSTYKTRADAFIESNRHAKPNRLSSGLHLVPTRNSDHLTPDSESQQRQRPQNALTAFIEQQTHHGFGVLINGIDVQPHPVRFLYCNV